MLNETLLAAILLAFSPYSAAADTPPAGPTAQQKAQTRNGIYGSQLMTPEERDAYRAKMKGAKTQAERDELRRQHHDSMQLRAKERGATLPDQPGTPGRAAPKVPGRSQGMGPGAPGPGPGPGMGRGPNPQ